MRDVTLTTLGDWADCEVQHAHHGAYSSAAALCAIQQQGPAGLTGVGLGGGRLIHDDLG
ncbi:hypothetical protein D9M73_289410 [compost metagenome]